MLRTLLQDAGFGARTLLKHWGFTLVAGLTLAVGIGANSAIFSVVNAVLLRPLPFRDPDELVMLYATNARKNLTHNEIAPADFAALGGQGKVFRQVSLLKYEDVTLTGSGEPEQVQAGAVSANFFALLGAETALGRGFLPQEERAGEDRVAVLSYGLWQRRFGGDRGVVGRPLNVGGAAYTVVGVLPARFEFLPANERSSAPEIWLPRALAADELNDRRNHVLLGVARLNRGVSLAQAQAEVSAVARRLEEQFPDSNAGWGLSAVPLGEQVVGGARTMLLVLLGAIALVLLIACANVANLLLARAASRSREIAIRTALGATRARIVRQLLTESVLLALVSGLCGIFLAVESVNALVHASPGTVPRVNEVGVDARVLGFTLLVSVAVGVVFGLAPALQASAPDLNESLKAGGKGAPGGAGRSRLRFALVISQVAISLVLLVGAGLLIKSFLRLLDVNPGFNAGNVLVFDVPLSPERYPEPRQKLNFDEQLLRQLREVPGVQAAAATNHLPLSGGNSSISFTVEGRPLPGPGEAAPTVNWRAVSPEYLRAMGIPLLKGRALTEQDKEDVVVVSESLVRRHFGGEDPLGKRLRLGGVGEGGPVVAVVGVAGDVRHWGLGAESLPQMYITYREDPPARMTFVVRAAANPQGLAGAVRAQVALLDKDQPITRLSTMEQLVAESVSRQRFSMLVLSLFAALALVLAAVGIYGVISYFVSQYRHEIGIRIALGAQFWDILRLVLRQGMGLAVLGVVVGVFGSVALTRMMSSLLFGVSATDPLTFVGTSLVLLAVALVACFIPAYRATKVDPLIALKYE